MGKRRPERTARRVADRDARRLVRTREKLAHLVAGGSEDHPITVSTAAVIEGRARAMPCPQCEGELEVKDHRSSGDGMRPVDVKCRQCGTPRTLWFRIVSDEPN